MARRVIRQIEVTRRETLGGAVAAAMMPAAPLTAQVAPADPPVGPDTLWYRQPALEWVEALPVGNGRLGAMVFGGVTTERLQLNEDSFFAGGPYDAHNPDAAGALAEVRRLIFAGDYAAAEALADARLLGRPSKQMSYQPIGDLALFFPGIEGVRDYRRELDLDGAVARTRFRTGETRHLREVIASAVDGVVAIRLSVTGETRQAIAVALATPQAATLSIEDGDILMRGIGPGRHGVAGAIRFETRARVLAEGAVVTPRSDGLYVEGAGEVVILLATATSFRAPDDVGGDPAASNADTFARLGTKSWDRILADHQADHRRLFRATAIELGTSDAAALPTDERVRRSGELDDPALAALYHGFGRYLLIASSRPGTQPANLQGIWNERTNPPWESKWTININTQMNYWPADMSGLGELTEPLLRMVEQLAVTGRRTARDMYGARGWMVHNNTDIFRQTAVVDGAKWALWPMGGAWLLQNLWDHWDYSRDRLFLERLYPLMAGACAFHLDTLQTHPDSGELVTSPSLSPENAHPLGASICAGPAMDSQLLRDLFTRTALAARLLRRDATLRRQLAAAARRLPADRIGKAGQLQEWMEDWDMDAPEIHHRHVSHLYALYPSDQITPERTPELAAAARRSLEIRGDEATGWGIGWRINLWARLGDGDRAHRVLRMLLDPTRTYPNLFDAHPPFQIDGNLGGVAGITAMLVASHGGTVHLLPALPAAWPSGRITGVRVRGGGVVDLSWRDGRLVEAVLSAGRGGRFRVRHGGETAVVAVPREGSRRIGAEAGRLVIG